MKIEKFDKEVKAEMVASNVIGVVDGVRVYLYQDGKLTPEGVTYYKGKDEGPGIDNALPPEPETDAKEAKEDNGKTAHKAR